MSLDHACPRPPTICVRCHTEMAQELAEWRTGKRRVFWRLKYVGIMASARDFKPEHHTKWKAMRSKGADWKCYIVRVRPKGAKR